MSSDLYLCVYARHFPAQALLRLRPELRTRPVSVLEGEVPFQQVCSSNKAAHMLGVSSGMSRSEIDSFPSVVQLTRSLIEEQAARFALLDFAGAFSPRIEHLEGGSTFCCVLDISGTEALFGSPQTIANQLREQYSIYGIACSAAVSINFQTAVSVARGTAPSKHPMVISAGTERHALSTLSLSVLDIKPEDVDMFSRLGIKTLGALAKLPEKELISRIGQEGKRLYELALGEASHLFVPLELTKSLEEQIDLEYPLDAIDSLMFAVRLILERMINQAASHALALTNVTVELRLEGSAIYSRTVRSTLPNNDNKTWLKLVHLEMMAYPPGAAVLSLCLRAETGRQSNTQLGLFSAHLPEHGLLDVTLSQLRAIVGEERVGSIDLIDTHAPASFHVKQFSIVNNSPSHDCLIGGLPVAVMRCLRPAELITVVTKNDSPHSLHFRGTGYDVEHSYGPWRTASEWWSTLHWSSEEWDVVARQRNPTKDKASSEILCCSISRQPAGNEWQMNALYD